MNYYHATSFKNIESIISNGFRASEGCLGEGVYISKSWQTALMFGRALLRVELTPGTRILDVVEKPDMKVIDSIKREFGKDILSRNMAFHKVIPRNKQLKLAELIELTKYHYHRTWCPIYQRWLADVWGEGKDRPYPFRKLHPGSLNQCWSMLRKYKYDGYGDGTSDIGIILSPDKLVVKELIAVVPYRPKKEFISLDSVKEYLKTMEKSPKKVIRRMESDESVFPER